MIHNCQFCNVNSAGTHEPHCPLHQSISKETVDSVLQHAQQINVGPEQVLIGQYIELLTAYAMTMDAIELAGEELGGERLVTVVCFIKRALDNKINEIIACEEFENGRNE